MLLRFFFLHRVFRFKQYRFLFLICTLAVFLAGCSHLLFYPQKNWQNIPELENYQYQVINIKAHDGILLNAWLMPHRKEKQQGAVIFFHGNSENISITAKQVFWLTDYGYDVLLVDYRGYGHSEGEVDLDNNISDIGASIQWFFERYDDKTPKYLIAHSLGASMAGYVVATHKDISVNFSGIVLDAGFADYRRIMRDVMSQNWFVGLFKYPASMGMPDNYDLIDVIGKISPTPLIIIHGKSDPVVPYQHGVDLFEKALSPKEFLSYEGYHDNAFDDVDRRQWLVDYFQRHAN
jgi:uncharacterized protein